MPADRRSPNSASRARSHDGDLPIADFNLGSLISSLAKKKLDNQAEHWSRQAARYDELFLDPYGPDVVNPLWQALAEIPDAAAEDGGRPRLRNRHAACPTSPSGSNR